MSLINSVLLSPHLPTPPPSHTQERRTNAMRVCELTLSRGYTSNCATLQLKLAAKCFSCGEELKKTFSFLTQVSQCLAAGPDPPIGSIFWPLLYPKVNHFPLITYSTLTLNPSGCVGYSNVLTQRFKMSFKSHSMLLGLFYFPTVRLQGQFAPTADERSIEDLNLKSCGPRGRSVAEAWCCHRGLSPEAQQRPISFHTPSTPATPGLVNSQDHD